MILQYGDLFNVVGYMESDEIIFTKADVSEASKRYKNEFEELKTTGAIPQFCMVEDYLLDDIRNRFRENISSIEFIGKIKHTCKAVNVAILINRTDKSKKATSFAFSDEYQLYLLNEKGKTIKKIQ